MRSEICSGVEMHHPIFVDIKNGKNMELRVIDIQNELQNRINAINDLDQSEMKSYELVANQAAIGALMNLNSWIKESARHLNLASPIQPE